MTDMTWEESINHHRNNRKEEIMDAAFQLFLEKEMPQVTMKDISAKVGISRVTLYKYYSDIHEIIFDFQIKALREIYDFVQQKVNLGVNGTEKLNIFLKAFIEVYREKADLIAFTGFFDNYYQKIYPTHELEEKYKNFLGENTLLLNILKEGVKDHSFSSDININMTAELISHTMTAMIQRFAIRGHLISKMRNIDPEDLLIELTVVINRYLCISKQENNEI
ncbi:TetR/AcrR family transcriptional regulator [Heyndrickxia sp. NPDC080065]|uniref:TetR/AcrR family transcriptional regulator n=1 Tax=Heyndrickxia sp. NPDC080065 TaxID=3390568 RepID=UPI003CFBF4F1